MRRWSAAPTSVALTSGTMQTLQAVWGSDASNVYVAGLRARSCAVPASSTTRHRADLRHDANLAAIYGTDASNVYVVGDGGTIVRCAARSISRPLTLTDCVGSATDRGRRHGRLHRGRQRRPSCAATRGVGLRFPHRNQISLRDIWSPGNEHEQRLDHRRWRRRSAPRAVSPDAGRLACRGLSLCLILKRVFAASDTNRPYRIVEAAGHWRYGAGLRSAAEPIQRRVAVKLLLPQFAQHPGADPFFNEARVVNLVEHPSIVQVSDYGQTQDGAAYLVMECLRGDSLSRRLKRLEKAGQSLPLIDGLYIASQIADALSTAHEKNIVHRVRSDHQNPSRNRDLMTGVITLGNEKNQRAGSRGHHCAQVHWIDSVKGAACRKVLVANRLAARLQIEESQRSAATRSPPR